MFFQKINMKKISLLSLLVFSLYMISCGPSQQINSSWVNKEADLTKKYTSVFIFAMTQNQSAKNIVETDLANAAKAKGFKVYKSSSSFPPEFTKGMPDKDKVLAKVKELGCDLIFTTALVDKQSESRYVPGTVAYAPYMGYGYGYGFGGYYNYMGPTMYDPGYYTEDKKYFLEANLFDAATEKMIWSAQSEAINPSTISKFSRDYTVMLMDKISRDLGRK
jgi:hypothetical protein